MDINARITIETELAKSSSFKTISELVMKDCNTISKKIQKHPVFERTVAYGRAFNDYELAFNHCCDLRCVCNTCTLEKAFYGAAAQVDRTYPHKFLFY